jgi:flavin-dependent dehydrogenase
MTLPRSTEVFVIGGGPAGLAAAIAARRRGLDVVVADRSAPAVDKACGEGIMPDGIAAAAAIGVDLEQAGGHCFNGIRFQEGAVSVAALFPAHHGLGLRRTRLHRHMTDCAEEVGVHVAWGARIDGICSGGVRADGRLVRARWIIGADGGHSIVRRWAGLEEFHQDSRRFGYRRHYRIAPWDDFMELHWSDRCQLYVTPIGCEEVCVALLSRDPRLRLHDALRRFPEIAGRLAAVPESTSERGAVTATRRLRRVWSANVALIGDASGSVDAITGEGLCLLFQQAHALADALAAGDLAGYESAHRRIGRRPELMAKLMLLLDRRRGLRQRAIRAMAERPELFAGMLAHHVGAISSAQFAANGLSLGWRMLQ